MVRSALNRSRTDPRWLRISKRDLDALAFIGEGYEVAQYQLHAAIFSSRAPNVVSRFVGRASARGMIAVDRWNRIGINRLRLTPVGRDFLVGMRHRKTAELFTPARPVAPKDASHTLWINDLRVALRTLAWPPPLVLPAWALQRRLTPTPPAIPDLLAVWTPTEGRESFVLACEVDLGGESLPAVFLPKLARLKDVVDEWSGGTPSTILVLTRGASRAARIVAATAAHDETPTMIVNELPPPGSTAITHLREMLQEILISECTHSPEAAIPPAR